MAIGFIQVVLWLFGIGIIIGSVFITQDPILLYIITLAISQFIISGILAGLNDTPKNQTRCDQLVDRFTMSSIVAGFIAIIVVISKMTVLLGVPIDVLFTQTKFPWLIMLSIYNIFAFIFNAQGVVLSPTQG